MSTDKKDLLPSEKDAMKTKKRMEELARAIRDEMGSLTSKSLNAYMLRWF